MMDIVERTSKIGSKDRARRRGSHASEALLQAKPFLDELRDIYMARMARKLRETGGVDNYAATALVVLQDIEQHFKEVKARGESAARKMDSLKVM